MLANHTWKLGATVVVVLLLVVAALVAALSLSGKSSPRLATPFAPDSVWNAPLPTDAPLAPNSAVLVEELERQVAKYGTWINTSSYSTPIYTVPANERRVPVIYDGSTQYASGARLAAVFKAGVPIPPHAQAAAGTDEDIVVWQPSTDTMWELWLAHQVDSSWHAQWGGRMDHVSTNPGYFTDPPDWGTSATSLALLGGTILQSDLRAGQIDHAIAISIPQAREGVFAFPAQRTDGKLNSPNAIPEGTRFRLDPQLNIDRLGLPPMTRMLAEAAQRYGIIVRDQGGTVAFYGQEATQATDPFAGPNGAYRGADPRQLTAAFPWGDLEVVRAPLNSTP